LNKSLEEILTGRLRKNELVSFLKKHPELFNETVRISLGDVRPQSWRAAWLIGHYMKDNDTLLLPYIDAMLSCITGKEDGHQRELLKILGRLELSEDQEGRLFDVCLSIWEEIHKSPSVRGTAFQTLLKIVSKYPELKSEIEHLTQSHYIETLSPGIKHSLYKLTGGKNETD
jgi:hypothetical protein